MRNAVASVHVRRPVGQDDVLGRHKHTYLAPKVGVVIDFFESTACGRQRPKHPLMLGSVLFHHVR